MKRILTTVTVCTFALGGLLGCGSTGSDPAAEPTTPAPGTGAAHTYTMAQVQEHTSTRSCWTAINGEVYDVTTWISAHPGGSDRIRGLCGTDGTAAFTGQHQGEGQPEQILESFKIGALAR